MAFTQFTCRAMLRISRYFLTAFFLRKNFTFLCRSKRTDKPSYCAASNVYNPLKTRPETSVNLNQLTPHNKQEMPDSDIHRGESLNSHRAENALGLYSVRINKETYRMSFLSFRPTDAQYINSNAYFVKYSRHVSMCLHLLQGVFSYVC